MTAVLMDGYWITCLSVSKCSSFYFVIEVPDLLRIRKQPLT